MYQTGFDVKPDQESTDRNQYPIQLLGKSRKVSPEAHR